jgi:parallel beta-helix repeat protein
MPKQITNQSKKITQKISNSKVNKISKFKTALLIISAISLTILIGFGVENNGITIASAGIARKIFVDKDNIGGNCSDSNSGSIDKPLCSISKAVSLAKAGTLINIRKGTYPSFSIESKTASNLSPIQLTSYNGERVVIDAAKAVNAVYVKKSAYILINGLEATNAAGSYGGGIKVVKSNNIVIQNNQVYGNLGTNTLGITIEDSPYVLIKNNESHNNYGTGIKAVMHPEIISTMPGVIIDRNKSYDNVLAAGDADGIGLNGVGFKGVMISNNIVYNNGDDGIDTWNTSGNTITNNITYNQNNAGDGNGIKAGGSTTGGNNLVKYNVSFNNKQNGFASNGSGNNKYYNNVAFENKHYGIEDGFRASNCTVATCQTIVVNNIGIDNVDGNFSANEHTNQSSNNIWYDSKTNSARIAYKSVLKNTLADFYKASGNRLDNPNGGATSSYSVDPLFSKVGIDGFRLSANSTAINKGKIIPSVTDNFNGSFPDLGAYEY